MTRTRHSATAFTLVEMLVVIGIVAILAALLLPAVMRAVTIARNTAIAIEINQLATAIESYKQDKGDYPPNFRDPTVVSRHIRKCYPKIDPTYFTNFMKQVFPTDGATATTTPVIDEAEAIVFWLAMTDNDPRYPFISFLSPGAGYTAAPKKYYDFDASRLSKAISADVLSYKAKYSKDSYYIYMDSRSYVDLCRFSSTSTYKEAKDTYGYADDTGSGVRPYWSEISTGSGSSNRDMYKAMNPTTFQIICAGQDGDYGYASGDSDVKVFPSGLRYNDGDNDNITNFSNGKMLKEAFK